MAFLAAKGRCLFISFSSKTGKITQQDSRGLCGGGQPEWRGRRGSTCADGSRASWNDDGCWAGRSAWWSRQFSSAGSGLPLVDRLGYRPDQGTIAGTHARNGRKQVPRLSGWALLVNAAGLPTASHTVSTAVEIAVEQPRPQRWMTKVIHRQCVFLLSAPRCGPKVVTTCM